MRKCNESHSKAGAVSLGFWNVNGPFELTDVDRAYGAEISQGLGEVSGSILIGVAPCGAANAGKYVKGAVKVYDAAGNAVDMARGAADMYKNGPSLSNVAQMAGGGAGFASGTIAKCFTEGTQIVVGAEYGENDVFVHYVTVNIEDIQVGDLVYSYDTVTGVVSQNEVTDVFVRESDHINYLTIADENGNIQIIETTDGHPFWVVTDEPDLSRAASEAVLENGTWIYHENVATGTNGYWIEVKDLQEGDVFHGVNGELSTLVSAERVQFDESITVYNFRVDGDHDYFVIAQVDDYGQTCILVHNGNGSYTITFDNGMKYHGKGDYDRALVSARKIEKDYPGVKRSDIDWADAPDTKTSFIHEHIRLDADGGPDSLTNYNKINSPGKIIVEKGGN